MQTIDEGQIFSFYAGFPGFYTLVTTQLGTQLEVQHSDSKDVVVCPTELSALYVDLQAMYKETPSAVS